MRSRSCADVVNICGGREGASVCGGEGEPAGGSMIVVVIVIVGEVKVGGVKVGGCRGRGVGARDRERRGHQRDAGTITRFSSTCDTVTCKLKPRGRKHDHQQ